MLTSASWRWRRRLPASASRRSSTPIKARSSPAAFTSTLKDAGIGISMDGRGRWMDNVFIERLWRSLKYECVFLDAFETGSEAKTGIGCWIGYYNADRPHSVLGGRAPDEVYTTQASEEKLAA